MDGWANGCADGGNALRLLLTGANFELNTLKPCGNSFLNALYSLLNSCGAYSCVDRYARAAWSTSSKQRTEAEAGTFAGEIERRCFHGIGERGRRPSVVRDLRFRRTIPSYDL